MVKCVEEICTQLKVYPLADIKRLRCGGIHVPHWLQTIGVTPEVAGRDSAPLAEMIGILVKADEFRYRRVLL